MNQDQFLSGVRSLLKIGGAYLISKGLADSTAWADITGAGLALAGVLWSHFQHADPPASSPTGPGGLLKVLTLAGALSGAAWLGCSCQSSKLENGGAYAPLVTNTVAGSNIVSAAAAPDIGFFEIDAAYQLGWNTINAAFEFEYNNRAYLFGLMPNLKHTLDTIRPQAVSANAGYLAARSGYMANPTPAGLTQLQTIEGYLTQLGQAAAALLPSSTNKIAPVTTPAPK